MLRNELEYRTAQKQIEYLRSELEKRAAAPRGGVSQAVADALRMKIGDIENELTEYERLKEGLQTRLETKSFDDIGELVIKARIARGWSQADLAEVLDMKQQQVQRYERNDWEKISLWRLQEVVEVLRLRFDIQAYLDEHEVEKGVVRISPLPHWEENKTTTPRHWAIVPGFRNQDTYETPNHQRDEPLAKSVS